jgi:hypothetical protein
MLPIALRIDQECRVESIASRFVQTRRKADVAAINLPGRFVRAAPR